MLASRLCSGCSYFIGEENLFSIYMLSRNIKPKATKWNNQNKELNEKSEIVSLIQF